MAETTEVVVFEIDVSSYEKSLAELSNSINALKADQKALQDASKDGSLETAKQLEAVNAQLKIQQQQYRTTQNVLVGYTSAQQKGVDVQNFANNSIQANRDLLKQLTAQYINTKNPSEKFTQQIKSLSDALKQQETAIGDNRRKVGDYAGEVLKALGGLQGFGGQIVGVAQNLGGAINAFKTAESGVKGFSLALATTGLPIIVEGLNLLIGAFKQFKPIADEVEKVTAAIGAGFNALVQGRDMSEAASQAYELTQSLQDLEDAQQALIISNSLFDSQIKQLMVSLKNKNLTEKEGKKILEDLRATEQERFKENSELAKEDLRIARQNFLNKTGLYSAELDALLERGRVKRKLDEEEIKSLMETGNLTREQVLKLIEDERLRQTELANNAEKRAKIDDAELKRIAELTAKVNQIKGDSAVLNEQIDNREEAFNARIAEQKKKRQEEEIKRIEERNKRIEIGVAETKKFEDELKKQQDALTKQREEEAKRESDAQIQRELGILTRIGTEQSFIDAIILQRNLDLQNQKLTETERKNIIEKSEREIAQIRKGFRDKEKSDKEKEIEDNIKLEQIKIQFASKVSSALIGFIGDVADASGANAAFQKTLAFFEIATKTAIALVGAITQAQDMPFPANLAAIGTGVAAVLSGIGSAVSLLRKSGNAPQAPKFATGIIGLEGPGTGTSDSIDAKLSKGESVMTAKATSVFHSELAAMEMAVGNKPNYSYAKKRFATGVIGSGGFATREVTNNAENAELMKTAIAEGFKKAPQPVVSVQEINRVNTQRNKSVAVSEL